MGYTGAMCGRFALGRTTAEELLAFFRVRNPADQAQDLGEGALPPLVPRYNIAPTQEVPVCRGGTDEAPGPRLEMMSWGLVPSWSSGSLAEVRRTAAGMINARAETVFEKPAFRQAIARRRALVPTVGFYEWDRSGAKPHPATLFHRPGRALFAMGAIWERWKGPDGILNSFSVLTCPASGVVAALHDRMPVLIAPRDFELWLDPAVKEPDLLSPLLSSAPEGWLQATVVGTTVNNARVDSEACWLPA